MRALFIPLAIFLSTVSCKPESNPPVPAKATPVVLTQKNVNLGTHKLATFSVIKNSDYLVVFEAGLGDDHTIWDNSNIVLKTSDSMDVVSYDRASHGESQRGPDPRDINRLQSELSFIIDAFANGRKIVLIGHSLGGFIIKDWAIKNPTRVAGLLFVDPSVNGTISQADQDAFYNSWLIPYGALYGSTLEAKEWKVDLEYMATLGNLPDVPVVVLTAMRVDAPDTVEGRQWWYDQHELLGAGVTDFTHLSAANSGHMVMLDEPQKLIHCINVLLAKLP
jgi:Predicted hydrolases or acyltransferases (alpha/beta hydrolase superfamily)